MITRAKPRQARVTIGLVIALFALSACAAANTNGQNNLDRHDRQLLDQVGGA